MAGHPALRGTRPDRDGDQRLVARQLRCQGCRASLGTVHGSTLLPLSGIRVSIDMQARRVTLTCPACGKPRDWRDGRVLIERERVIDSLATTDETATGRR